MDLWWQQIWTTVNEEFSDLTDLKDLKDLTRVTLRLLVAALLGALVGYDREARNKSAGLRTHMLVALGSAIFILTPLQADMTLGNFSRVLQGVIAGIGFLGAGAILKLQRDEEIQGLTMAATAATAATAASIWITAAIGIAAGMGREMTATLSAAITLFVLSSRYQLEAVVAARKRREGHEAHE
ncbi:MAG: MgtC/SapB family protein [Burkholderiaceae bacterium]